jgi:hypothetical protein
LLIFLEAPLYESHRLLCIFRMSIVQRCHPKGINLCPSLAVALSARLWAALQNRESLGKLFEQHERFGPVNACGRMAPLALGHLLESAWIFASACRFRVEYKRASVSRSSGQVSAAFNK